MAIINKKLISLIIIWIIIVLLDYYYYFPYFIQPFIWFFTVLVLFILLIIQVRKIIKERKKISKSRILKFSTLLILFALTFYNFYKIPRKIIEKIDWITLQNKRNEIVNEVKNGKLIRDNKLNNGIYKIPFEFPVLSNGGNEVWVFEEKNKKTVKFWISRGFFDSPQSYFIYTENPADIKSIDELIKKHPENNWKIKENWYRVLETF
ncbi:Uncharacterised protein [Algoriella xinjiangensis]|nr:Uncharacterised protein [Algoriella xinjiangensis]